MTGVSEPENMMMASGTQARMGIGRSISNTGKTYSRKVVDHPSKQAHRHAQERRQREGDSPRRRLVKMCW